MTPDLEARLREIAEKTARQLQPLPMPAKGPQSQICKAGDHGWCMNRTPSKTHCNCDCHTKKIMERHTRLRSAIESALREVAALAAQEQRERDAPVNWQASYEQACEDADAYKVTAEARIVKAEQNWRSCQHEIEYLRAALKEHKAAAAIRATAPERSE